MELTAHALDLTLATPFRISRSVQTHARNVLTQIATEEAVGLGEAAPSGFYGERRESVFMALTEFSEHLDDDPSRIEDIMEALDKRLRHGNAAAKASVDMALYDILGKRLGAPVYELLGLNPERAPVTSFTIGIDEPAEMAKKAAAAAKALPDFEDQGRDGARPGDRARYSRGDRRDAASGRERRLDGQGSHPSHP